MDWLMNGLYGLLSGLTGFFPVSADAHQAILLRLFGKSEAPAVTALLTNLGCLLGLLVCCRRDFYRLRRARRQSRSSRRGTGDTAGTMTLRMFGTAVWPMLLCLLLSGRTRSISGKLSLVALFLVLNGVLLYLPRFFSRGNKDARSLSRMDGLLLGLGAGVSVVPGFSRVGTVVSLGAMRGASSGYALSFALLMSVPALLLTMVLKVPALIGESLGAMAAVQGLVAGIGAFLGSLCSITTMRFLSVKSGFTGFAYYCWGAAFFAFILFMMT